MKLFLSPATCLGKLMLYFIWTIKAGTVLDGPEFYVVSLCMKHNLAKFVFCISVLNY